MQEKEKANRFAYINEYAKEHYDRLCIKMPKGYKEKIQKLSNGKSITQFLKMLIDDYESHL